MSIRRGAGGYQLERTRRVVEVQSKLSALLEDLSAESANNDTKRRR
jgi:hypothetical protein